MEKLKDKIEKYINKTGVIRTPAYFIKDLFNEVVSKFNFINKLINSLTDKNKELEQSVTKLEVFVQDWEIKQPAIEVTYIKDSNYNSIYLVNDYNQYNGLIVIDNILYSDRNYKWKEGEFIKTVKYITDDIGNNFFYPYDKIQKIEINKPVNIDISNFVKAPIHINSSNVKVLNNSSKTEFNCDGLYLNYYVEFPSDINIKLQDLYLGNNFIYDENHITDFSKFKNIKNLHLYDVNKLPTKDSPHTFVFNSNDDYCNVFIHESCKLNLYNVFKDSINITCNSNDVYCGTIDNSGLINDNVAIICNNFETNLKNISLFKLFFHCNKLILHKYNNLNLRASFNNVEIIPDIKRPAFSTTYNNDTLILTTDDVFYNSYFDVPENNRNNTITIVQKGVLGLFSSDYYDVILNNVSIFNYIHAKNIHIYGKLIKITNTINTYGTVYVYDMDEKEFLNIPIENSIPGHPLDEGGHIENLYIKNKKIDTVFIDSTALKISNLIRARTVILDLTNFNYLPSISYIMRNYYDITTIKYLNWPTSTISFSPNVVKNTVNTIIIASMTAPSITTSGTDYLKNNGTLIVPTGATGFDSSAWQNLFVDKHNWTIEYSDELAAELNGHTTT